MSSDLPQQRPSGLLGLSRLGGRQPRADKPEPLFHIDRDAKMFPRARLIPLLLAAGFPLLFALLDGVFVPLPALNLADWEAMSRDVFQYSLLIPAAAFCGALLGPIWAVLAVLGFLAGGLLGVPWFANGGGMDYLSEPGFGYLFGLLFCALMAGNHTHHRIMRPRGVWDFPKGLFRAAFIPVVTVHGLGVAYLVGLALFGVVSLTGLWHYVVHLSLWPLPYDVLITLCLLYWVRVFRAVGWLVLY